ncbi:MAG TPA: sensor domain-containing diguanylate cyclase [Thiomicrorhabdus sp.]|nr:sensor domain-containing diguanylate cyclase [Thiomicrorhabdus sp.]
MLELSNRLLEKEAEIKASSSAERLMDVDRSRTQKMIDRSPFKMDSDAAHILQTLQARFSSDDSIPQDIEAMIEAQVTVRTQSLFRQANYDDLTHLPNRAYFNATLEALVIDAQQDGGEFTLLFLDLDGFKNINDSFGHHAGDELLRNVSARVISAVREGDIVSRLGGDEFVVLLAGALERTEIEGICSRIIGEVRRPYWIDQNDIQISTSIGVARYPMDAKSSSELVEKSDKALYASKDSGRNTFRFYCDLATCEIQSDCNPIDRLEKALTQGKVKICFEPQVDLVSQKIMGSSVTALWMEGQMESPYLSGWMDVLNQSRLASSTGAWLIDSGLYYLQQWQAVNNELVVSIPVVPALCQSENMVDFMQARLETYQVNISQIQLEFSMNMMEDESVRQQVKALSGAGYQITLTEIGKTALDIALLSEFNLQEVKLDAKWLKKALSHSEGKKWVNAVVQMVNVLDAEVIATGIDFQTEMDQLLSMGCSIGQGVFWALPLEADGFYQAISAQRPVVH